METEITLKVSIKWERLPDEEGGSDDRGNVEILKGGINLTSVKVISGNSFSDVEILPILSQDQIEELTNQII